MIDRILQQHQKIALEFSGGKDSMACLYKLKEFLHRITVYWCNTGDYSDETLDIIEQIKKFCPNFVEIKTDVRTFTREMGFPSDVIPTETQLIGSIDQLSDVQLVGSMACCFNNIMLPLHQKVIADGNTCIIRGQKNSDKRKGNLKSGDIDNGIEYYYPIENMTDYEVMQYLDSVNAPIHPVYKIGTHGMDCMHCTGWWEHRQQDFLVGRYPDVYSYVMGNRKKINYFLLKQITIC